MALAAGRGNQRLGPLAGGRLPVYFFHQRNVCHSQDFSEKGWNRKDVLGSLDRGWGAALIWFTLSSVPRAPGSGWERLSQTAQDKPSWVSEDGFPG